MENKESDEKIRDLNNDILDLIEKHEKNVPLYEVIHSLIHNAVSCSLYCAPNELEGVKTVMSSIQYGICNYEQTHS